MENKQFGEISFIYRNRIICPIVLIVPPYKGGDNRTIDKLSVHSLWTSELLKDSQSLDRCALSYCPALSGQWGQATQLSVLWLKNPFYTACLDIALKLVVAVVRCFIGETGIKRMNKRQGAE